MRTGEAILLLAPSPARQRILEIAPLAPGAVHRVKAVTECSAGKAVNAARVLSRLGIRSQLLAFTERGKGKRLSQEMGGPRVSCVSLPCPLRICTTLVEPEGRTTEMVEPQADIGPEACREFMKRSLAMIPKARAVLMAGSLPPGFPPDAYRQWVRCCRLHGVPSLADVHGERLCSLLDSPPDALKPNLSELVELLGEAPRGKRNTESFLKAAFAEIYRKGKGWLFLSEGSRGAWSLLNGECLHIPAPSVRVKNAIGAGDSAAAVMTSLMDKGLPHVLMASLAVKIASLSCTTLLPGELPEEAVKVYCDTLPLQ
ncbi:MAG: hypothetical protein HQL31_13200 [Planctomycetes bacterium]|nr:hypothetical protein [Planctomycetota bacterium]